MTLRPSDIALTLSPDARDVLQACARGYFWRPTLTGAPFELMQSKLVDPKRAEPRGEERGASGFFGEAAASAGEVAGERNVAGVGASASVTTKHGDISEALELANGWRGRPNTRRGRRG